MSGEAYSEPHERAARRIGLCINGKYTIQRLLGVGGMAAVYEATHRNSKRCAIKILHPELSAVMDIKQRFLKEGYAANSVAHPGAVVVDDDDTAEDGAAYLVMELLEGETVDGLANRHGATLDPALVMVLGDQLLDVLGAAHEKGIVHRDIKPENLFVNRGTQLKVLDFGIARLREASGDSRRTVDGTVMGTPAFMPPEQASGLWAQVDARSDLWSVGATLFTLLTGRLVHEGSTINEALAASITQSARPIRDYRPDLPGPIADVIDRALQRDKALRFADAAAMRIALRSAYLQVYGQDLPPLPFALSGSGTAVPIGHLPTAMAPSNWARATPAPGGTAVQPPPWSLAGYGTGSAPGLGTSPPVTASQFKTRRTGTVALVVLLLLAGVGGAAALLLGGTTPQPAPTAVAPTEPPAKNEPVAPPSQPAADAPRIAPASGGVLDMDGATPPASAEAPADQPPAAPAAPPAKENGDKPTASEAKRPVKSGARPPPRKPPPAPVARPVAASPTPPPEPAKPKKPFDPFAKRD